MVEQITFFYQDLGRIIGAKKYRIFILLFTRSFWGLLNYRMDRGLYLLFGKLHGIIRLPLLPFFILLQSFSNIDIHYKADVKGGILILHPSLGIVISGRATVGKNITLTGGNVIGISKAKAIPFVIGDYCNLGANAVIIGPLEIGNYVTIGALACVTQSFNEDYITLVGIPSKKIS
jgi:serine acetyltransferase